MTDKEAKLIALGKIWGWTSYLCEHEEGELSETLSEDVEAGEFTEKDAFKVQKQIEIASNKLISRMRKLRPDDYFDEEQNKPIIDPNEETI